MSTPSRPQLNPQTRLRISADAVQTLHRAAQLVYPNETCGLLLGEFRADGEISVKQAVVTPNVAAIEDRRKRYEIDPRLLLQWERVAQKSGLTTVGFFHSHPDDEPRPSATDASLAWPSYAYVIVGVAASSTESSTKPLVTGVAAWTFDDSAARFTELPVTVDIADDQIEYFI